MAISVKVKFESLKPGDKFFMWGDDLNYGYPKECVCEKVNEDTGREVRGISFCMSGKEDVQKLADELA